MSVFWRKSRGQNPAVSASERQSVLEDMKLLCE